MTKGTYGGGTLAGLAGMVGAVCAQARCAAGPASGRRNVCGADPRMRQETG